LSDVAKGAIQVGEKLLEMLSTTTMMLLMSWWPSKNPQGNKPMKHPGNVKTAVQLCQHVGDDDVMDGTRHGVRSNQVQGDNVGHHLQETISKRVVDNLSRF